MNGGAQALEFVGAVVTARPDEPGHHYLRCASWGFCRPLTFQVGKSTLQFPTRKVKGLMNMTYPTEAEARVALHGAEQARQRVISQIGMPWWYWWGLAACWIGLGVLADLHAPWWLVAGAT